MRNERIAIGSQYFSIIAMETTGATGKDVKVRPVKVRLVKGDPGYFSSSVNTREPYNQNDLSSGNPKPAEESEESLVVGNYNETGLAEFGSDSNLHDRSRLDPVVSEQDLDSGFIQFSESL